MDSINDLYVDREQNVWITGKSLFRFDSNRPTFLNSLSGSQINKATKLMRSRDGALWVGIKGGGLGQFNDEIVKIHSSDNGFVGGLVKSLLEDSRGGVWIGTDQGVSHFDGEQFASLTDGTGLSSNRVNALAEDSSGRIWMGTVEGITIYNPYRELGTARDAEGPDSADTTAELTGSISHLTTINGLQHNEINALLADTDGSVWIGSAWGGMCRWRENAVQRFDQPTEVYCFLQSDSNDHYAGGVDGLYHYDGTQ